MRVRRLKRLPVGGEPELANQIGDADQVAFAHVPVADGLSEQVAHRAVRAGALLLAVADRDHECAERLRRLREQARSRDGEVELHRAHTDRRGRGRMDFRVVVDWIEPTRAGDRVIDGKAVVDAGHDELRPALSSAEHRLEDFRFQRREIVVDDLGPQGVRGRLVGRLFRRLRGVLLRIVVAVIVRVDAGRCALQERARFLVRKIAPAHGLAEATGSREPRPVQRRATGAPLDLGDEAPGAVLVCFVRNAVANEVQHVAARHAGQRRVLAVAHRRDRVSGSARRARKEHLVIEVLRAERRRVSPRFEDERGGKRADRDDHPASGARGRSHGVSSSSYSRARAVMTSAATTIRTKYRTSRTSRFRYSCLIRSSTQVLATSDNVSPDLASQRMKTSSSATSRASVNAVTGAINSAPTRCRRATLRAVTRHDAPNVTCCALIVAGPDRLSRVAIQDSTKMATISVKRAASGENAPVNRTTIASTSAATKAVATAQTRSSSPLTPATARSRSSSPPNPR